jgi:hypothetical protein
MGLLPPSTFRAALRLSPLALFAACAVVTPDDNGLFAPGKLAVGAGGAGGGDGGGGTGGIQANGSSGSPDVQLIDNADSCQNAYPIVLTYGAGRNLFVGSGDTRGDTTPTDDSTCTTQFGSTVNGPDRVHAITTNAPDGGYLTARLLRGDGKTEFDAALYVRSACEGDISITCADAFSRVDGVRTPANGGELLSIPVPEARDTVFYLYVDGIGQGVGGQYELEISLNKGDCEDPVPIFVEPGSPVRATLSTKNARNVMTHSCGVSGTADVIYRVTRGAPGVMGVAVESNDSDFSVAFMDQTCDERASKQTERPQGCDPGPNAFLGEAGWPDPQRSIFVSVETGNPGLNERIVNVVFDPTSAEPP